MMCNPLLVAGALALTGTLSACGTSGAGTVAAASPSPSPSPSPAPVSRLYGVFNRCTDEGLTLSSGDEFKTLIIDTKSKYGSQEALNCVLTDLETSAAITASLENTTALMGVQDADEDGISYKWSYHPDNGVNMIIKDVG